MSTSLLHRPCYAAANANASGRNGVAHRPARVGWETDGSGCGSDRPRARRCTAGDRPSAPGCASRSPCCRCARGCPSPPRRCAAARNRHRLTCSLVSARAWAGGAAGQPRHSGSVGRRWVRCGRRLRSGRYVASIAAAHRAIGRAKTLRSAVVQLALKRTHRARGPGRGRWAAWLGRCGSGSWRDRRKADRRSQPGSSRGGVRRDAAPLGPVGAASG